MLRTISAVFIFSIYGILPVWAQSDAPEGRSTAIQPTPIQRGIRTSPGSGRSMCASDMSSSPALPSVSSQSQTAAPVTPSFNPEPVPVIPIKEGENGHVRTVCRLGNVPANSAAITLTKLLKTEGESVAEPGNARVVIVPEVIGNCLLISGPPAAVEEVRRLVSEIDRPAPSVRLEVQISEVLSDKEKKAPDAAAAKDKTAGDESSKTSPEQTEEGPIVRAELSTLDNQECLFSSAAR